ncbi:MAG: class I SAM-dependent methyltransferase [Anaerolineales bacterium]
MGYLDPRVRILEDRRRRCRELIDQIQALPWERVEECDLCGESTIVVLSNRDRYGIRLQAGMCLHCGLIFLLDRLSAEGYAEFYSRYYRPLLSRFFGRKIDPKSIQREQLTYASQLVAFLRQWLKSARDTSTLLDIGGSTGVVALEFSDAFGYQATVLDPATDELEQARSKGLRVVKGLLETYEGLEARSFDLVLMCQTIDHLLSLRDSLIKVGSLVETENGYFFVDIVDFDEMCDLAGCVQGALHLDHCYYLSHETALAMFSELGWQLVSVHAAMKPGHVGYLLRSGNGDRAVGWPDGSVRLRRFQRLQTQWLRASRHTYGTVHWLRKRAFRARRYLRKMRNQ